MELSQKAKNNIEMLRGNNPSKITSWLKMLPSSIVNELKQYYNADDINELSVKISMD